MGGLVWWCVSVLTCLFFLCVGECPPSEGEDCGSARSLNLLPFLFAVSVFFHSMSPGSGPLRNFCVLRRFYQTILCSAVSMMASDLVWPQISYYSNIAAEKIVSSVKFAHTMSKGEVFSEMAQFSQGFWSNVLKMLTGCGLVYVAGLELLATVSHRDIVLDYVLGCGRKEVAFAERNSYYTIPNREEANTERSENSADLNASSNNVHPP